MLKRLQNWIDRHFRSIFLLLLTGFLIAGSITLKDNYLIITKYTPSGIINWEINMNNARRDSILKEWHAGFKKNQIYTSNINYPKTVTGIETAIAHNDADYVFIAAYVGLLLVLIIRVGSKKANPRRIVIPQRTVLFLEILAILTGLTDVSENIGTNIMLQHFRLREPLPDAWTIGVFGWAKYLLLAMVLSKLLYEAFKLGKHRFWLEFTSTWLRKLRGYGWRFRIVLFTLIGFFLLLFFSGQVQDMLLSINTSRRASFYFLSSITLLALLCWHLPKAIDNAIHISFGRFFLGPVDFNNTRLPVGMRPSVKVDIGRLFGAACFLIPATGILRAMDAYHIDYELNGISPIIILAAIIAFYTIALRHRWIDRIYKRGKVVIAWRYWLSMALLLLPIAIWGLGYEKQTREPYFLAYLSIDLIFLSAIFIITATLRTAVPAIAKWHIAPWVIFSGLAAMLFFIACNFPSFLNGFTRSNRFYTMPIVFCAVAGYLLFFSFLLYAGKKTGISLITFLLVITVYRSVSTITAYHETYVQKQTNYHKSLDSLNGYTEQWLKSRRLDIKDFIIHHPNQPYPVFFVNAYGGGIRATVWTTMVIGALDSLLNNGRTDDNHVKDFQHYVFSYSGASGGTVGLALLCGARYQHTLKTTDDTLFYPINSLAVYRNDYLSSDIVGLLGRDMLASALGIAPWADRARLMEQDWERHTHTRNINMAATMGEIWKRHNYEIPLLFSNTFDVDSGKKGISAPVILDSIDFPATIFIEQEIKDPGDLRLSTAAFLSARFPYISPTAKLNRLHHFIDGGIWDNSGAETSLEVLNVFERVRNKLAKEDTIFNHIQAQFLSLPNSAQTPGSTGKPENLFELMAPIEGLLNSRVGYMKKADGWNYSLAKMKNYGFFQFQPTAGQIPNTSISPVLPLGWQISDYAMTKMRISVLRDSSTLDKVLARFGIIRKKKWPNHR